MLRALWATMFLLGATTAPAQPPSRETSEATLRPGDRVSVWLFDRPSTGTPWTHRAVIDAEGQVELPLAGRVRLGGLAAAAAQDTLRARLGAFLQPGVGAFLVERRITVTGAVARPDVYFVDATMSLREAIGLAGGVAETGDQKRLLLHRDGVTREFRNWQLAGGDAAALQSGDQLVVPRLSWYRRNALQFLSVLGAFGTLIVSVTR